MVIAILSWKNSAIPSAAFSTAIVFASPWLFRICIDTFKSCFAGKDSDEAETVEGIPTDELLDYLFTVKTFKRDDVEARFKIPRYKYTILSKRLKESGVLTHGINNETVLSSDVTRAFVAGVLTGDGEPVKIVRPIPSSFTKREINVNPMETYAKPMRSLCATV